MALCQCLAQPVTPDGLDATAQAHAVLLLGGKATSAEPLLASYPTLDPKLFQVRASVVAQSVVACKFYIVNCHVIDTYNSWYFRGALAGGHRDLPAAVSGGVWQPAFTGARNA